MFEEDFLIDQLLRLGKRSCKHSYTKNTNLDLGRKTIDKVKNMISRYI